MQPLKASQKVTRFVLLGLCLALPCFAGGGNDGGSNSINHKLIEDYRVDDLTTLRGYNLYREKLAVLRRAAPVLAKLVEAQERKIDWYNIPVKNSAVSEEKTGLHFPTDQDCYQDGREVFCDKSIREKMNEETLAKQIMHELLMSLRENKRSGNVRQIVGRIFAGTNPRDIQAMLSENHFGLYISEHEQDLLRSIMRQRFYAYLTQLTDDGLRGCESSQMSAKNILSTLEPGRFNLWKFYSPFPETAYNLLTNVNDIMYQAGGARAFSELCSKHSSKVAPEICAEWSEIQYARSNYGYNRWFADEDKLRTNAAKEVEVFGAVGTPGYHLDGEIKKLYPLLVRDQSFLNIAALAVSEESAKLWRNGKDRDPVVDTVVAHKQTLGRRSPAETRKLLCNSLSSFSRELTRVRERERENLERGDYRLPRAAAERIDPPAVEADSFDAQ